MQMQGRREANEKQCTCTGKIKGVCHLPVNEYTGLTGFFTRRVAYVGTIQGPTWRPVVQTVMDKGITAREVLENVGVIDIVQGDLEMLESSNEGRVLCELPVNRRNDMCDICCLELFVAP